jgi:hypothetical protein
MALSGLVLAHDLAFLAKYGAAYTDALARSGHDDRWTAAVTAVALVSAALLLAGSWRLHRLYRLAASVSRRHGEARLLVQARPSRPARLPAPRTFFALLGRSWIVLGLSVAVLFVLQENIEHVSRGLGAPGLAVLAADGDLSTVQIIIGTTLAVAAVAALFRWHGQALAARIAAARVGRRARHRADRPRHPQAERQTGSLLGRRQGLRAPPVLQAI